MSENESLPKRVWAKFRSWPLWGQIIAGVVVLSVIVGPFLSEEDEKEPEASAPTTTEAPAETTVPPETTSTEAPATTTTAPDGAAALLPLVRNVCEVGGDAYGDALAAFVDNGPSPATAAGLEPATAALEELRGALDASDDVAGAKDLLASVDLFLRSNDSLAVLYAEGETAYQAEVPPSENADDLQEQANSAWATGAETMFGSDDAPDSPKAFPPRSC